jgi:hypothetical protein
VVELLVVLALGLGFGRREIRCFDFALVFSFGAADSLLGDFGVVELAEGEGEFACEGVGVWF